MAEHDRRQSNPHHPLGERHRPEQIQRRDHRLSHRVPEPCGPDPVRRRQLDDHGCRFQGRNAGQRQKGSNLRVEAQRPYLHRRCGDAAPAHYGASGSASGGASHQGSQRLGQRGESDGAVHLAVPDAAGLPAGRGAGDDRQRSHGLRRHFPEPVAAVHFLLHDPPEVL